MAKKASRSVRGGPVGWNRCKSEMVKSIGQLERTLKSPKVPPTRRRQLALTLKVIRGMYKVASQIDCAGPLMSFDLGYALEDQTATTTRTRKKR